MQVNDCSMPLGAGLSCLSFTTLHKLTTVRLQAGGIENAAPVPDRAAKPVGKAARKRAAKKRAAQQPAAHQQHAAQHPVADAAPAAGGNVAAADDPAPGQTADGPMTADPDTDDLAADEVPLPPPAAAAVKQDDWMICPLTQASCICLQPPSFRRLSSTQSHMKSV